MIEKDAPNNGREEFRVLKLSFIVSQVGFIRSIIEFNEYKELRGNERKEESLVHLAATGHNEFCSYYMGFKFYLDNNTLRVD